MTATDTATYSLTDEHRTQIAALHYVAWKDNARPLLQGVRIKYSGKKLSFTVTDSFRLVERAYDVAKNSKNNALEVTRLDGNRHGEIVVNAVALRDAFKAVKNAMLVRFIISDDSVTVATDLASTTLPRVVGEYPKVDQYWTEHPSIDPMQVKYLAINAQYLYDLARSTGRTPSKMQPVVLKGSDELKPIHVTMPNEGSWRALLMPVRI